MVLLPFALWWLAAAGAGLADVLEGVARVFFEHFWCLWGFVDFRVEMGYVDVCGL